MILLNLNLVYKPTIKIIVFIILSIVSTHISAQNPVLEFAEGDGNPTGNGYSTTTTIQFRNNSNNPAGNTFSTYTSPTALKVTATLSNQQYQHSTIGYNAVVFGYLISGATPIFPLMNTIGEPINSYFTSAASNNGSGVDINQNRSLQLLLNSAALRIAGVATNARAHMADITFTFNRPVNNPILHIGGIGGYYGNQYFYTDCELLSANTAVTFSKLSGTSALSASTTNITNSSTNYTSYGTGDNAGSGSVQINGEGLTSITIRLYLKGSGGDDWCYKTGNTYSVAGDAITMGFSVAESDLAITKTVNNNKPKPGNDVVFTLTARNNGLSNNTGVSATDKLPSGYTFKSATASIGTYNSSTGIWSIGNMNSGATATLDITATVKQNGIFDNSVTISASSGINDPVASNNIAICEVKIDSDGDGIEDIIDFDDDNDGISDCMEKGLSAASTIEQIFELNGDAIKISANEVQFTSNNTYRSGQMWTYGKVDFNNSFTLNFQAYLGTIDADGADGIATVFHNSPLGVNATGATGDGLGARGIANGIVLELDTWDNGVPTFGDLAADHGQIWDSDNQTGTGLLTSAVALTNLENGAWHNVVIDWNATTKTISYTVNGIMAGSFTGDLITNYFGGASKVYFGYTASTGGSVNDQRIRINNFCSDLPFDLDSDNDGLPNHLDTDSDNDGCYDAIEGGDNALSEHINPNGSINTVTNGGIDSNGVPNLINTGGAADTDNKQGQSFGNAYNNTLNSCENYWIGTTGNRWEDAINWTAQEMPVPGEDLIFATVANNGTSTVNDLKLPSGTEKTVENLINLSAKAIIIPAGSGLIVEETVSGSETNANKIILEASANTPNGTLLVKNGCATTVMATVQLYAKGSKGAAQNWVDNIAGSPTFGQSFSSSYKWQYFGIPVSSIKADPAFYGSFLREYSEPKNAADSYYNKWNTLNNASTLTAFKGYAITQDNPKVISLQGKLELCDREIKLTRTATSVAGSTSNNIDNSRYGLGQNIFGNSFTGAIPIDQIDFNNIKVNGSATTNDGTLVEKTVYLYNTGSFGEWTGVIGQKGSADAVMAGVYRAIPNNVSSALFNQIPSMQGFLLRHTGAIGTEITMTLPYGKLAKNTRPQTSPRAPLSHLEIELNSASTIDKLWLFSIPGTGNNFDNGWDGRKHFGTPTAFIYASTADGNMQVNTTDNLIGTAIAFVPNEDKHYSLTLKKSNLDTQYDSLFLIDLMLNKAIALDREITTYEFSADQKGIASIRFFISNNPQTAASGKSGQLWAYSSEKQLHVYNRTNETCTIQIYDQSGRNILVQDIAAQSSIQLNPNLHTGFYLVKMNAGSQSHATMIHFE